MDTQKLDLPPIQIDPVEAAINRSSWRVLDKMLKHFGYEISESWSDAVDIYGEHYTIEGNEWFVARHGFELHDDAFRSDAEACGFALEHVQENIDAEDVLEFLEGK